MIVTLMKKKFVDQYHWIDDQEMLDLVAIAQSCPGPIAVNGAIVVGYQLARRSRPHHLGAGHHHSALHHPL